jgi:hypothetical protein
METLHESTSSPTERDVFPPLGRCVHPSRPRTFRLAVFFSLVNEPVVVYISIHYAPRATSHTGHCYCNACIAHEQQKGAHYALLQVHKTRPFSQNERPPSRKTTGFCTKKVGPRSALKTAKSARRLAAANKKTGGRIPVGTRPPARGSLLALGSRLSALGQKE